MMREATDRIRALEKKTKEGTEPGMGKVFLSIISKLDRDEEEPAERGWQGKLRSSSRTWKRSGPWASS